MTQPLTWKTDLLLLDGMPKSNISLNELLRSNCSNTQGTLAINPLTNFYGLLVRKRDFTIKGDSEVTSKKVRILARMPFLPLKIYSELQALLPLKVWLLAEASRDYFYHSAMHDHSIKSWKNRIERYMEREAIPLPIIRTNEELWKEVTKQVQREKKIIIQSAKGERSIIPLEITEKLVYLLGIIDGDGHLSKHQVHIVDYSKKQIEQLQQFFQELFGVTGDIREGNNGNYYILLVNGKWIVRLVYYITGHPLGRKYQSLREPLLLREKSWEHLRGVYWRGLFDADASYKKAAVFTSISKKLTIDLHNFLKDHDIDYNSNEIMIEKGNNAYVTFIPSGNRKKLSEQIGCWHVDKKKQLLQLIKNEQSRFKTFQGMNEKNLTNQGYFDFSLLPRDITVVNIGEIIRKKRMVAGLSRKNLAQQMEISYNNLSTYEINRANPNLAFLLRYLDFCKESLMPFLETKSLHYFQIKNTKVKLYLKPTKELLTMVTNLYPLSNHYVGLKTVKPRSINTIEQFFDISIDTNTNRFSNSVLHHFLTTFFIYN